MQAPALLAMVAIAGALAAQDTIVDAQAKPAQEPDHKTFLIETGTRIPLSMVNSVSTKTTGEATGFIWKPRFPSRSTAKS